MTANNPSMQVTSTSDTGTPPVYRPHDMQQLGTNNVGSSDPTGGTGDFSSNSPGSGLSMGGGSTVGGAGGAQNFRSVGDYASSGNYAGGTGSSDEPIDVKQAQFNNQPYMRRPFGPQEM